jgi:putative NADH-flavin reductase
MMKLLVIGATGGTGRCVVEHALRAGHEVTAFARTPQKLTMQHERLRLAQGDVLQTDAVSRAMQGQQAVICALGPAAGTAPGTITSEGSRNIIQAMKQERVRRLVFESGIMVGEGKGLSAINRFLLAIFRNLNRALYEDKVRAEKLIRESGIDWVIVRPPKLKHMSARGNYRAGEALHVNLPAGLAHADVADFMVKSVASDAHLHQLVEIGY